MAAAIHARGKGPMTDAQYNRVRKAESRIRELYNHFAPTCHYDLGTLCRHREDIFNDIRGTVPQYAIYGLRTYCEAYHEMFSRNHLTYIYVTPIGKLETGSDAYKAYVDEVTPRGFTEMHNQGEIVYRDDFDKVYFQGKE